MKIICRVALVILFVGFLTISGFSQNSNSSKLNRVVWSNVSKFNIESNKAFMQVLKLNYYNDLFERDKSMTKGKAVRKTNQYESQVLSNIGIPSSISTSSEFHNYQLDLASQLPSRSKSELALSLVALAKRTYDYVTTQNMDYDPWVEYSYVRLGSFLGREIFTETNRMLDHFGEGSDYANGLDELFGKAFGAYTYQTAKQILDANPNFTNHLNLEKLLDDVNSQKELLDIQNKILEKFGEQLASLEHVQRENNKILEEVRNRNAEREKLERKREELSLIIQTAQTGINFFSQLIELTGNKDLSHKLYQTGASVVQIAESINNFENVTSKLEGFKHTAGTISLAANIFSAAFNIFQLFASRDEQINQIIISKLDGISKQIDTLYFHMHERFDGIDKRFEILFENLGENFKFLHKELYIANVKLDDLQSSFFETLQQILYSESTILERQKNTATSQLRDYINEVQENDPFLYPLEYNNSGLSYLRFANYFHLWATKESIRNAELETSGISLNDNSIAKWLSQRHNQFSALNFINRVSKEKLNAGQLSSTIIPNTLDWLMGANAYLLLIDKYPNFFKRSKIKQIDEIISTGELILNAQQSILFGSDSSKGKQNQLLDSCLSNYKKLNYELIDLIYNKKKEIEFLELDSLQLFKRQNQDLQFNGTIKFVNKKNQEYPFSNPTVAPLIPKVVQLAERLDLGKIQFNYEFIDQPARFENWIIFQPSEGGGHGERTSSHCNTGQGGQKVWQSPILVLKGFFIKGAEKIQFASYKLPYPNFLAHESRWVVDCQNRWSKMLEETKFDISEDFKNRLVKSGILFSSSSFYEDPLLQKNKQSIDSNLKLIDTLVENKFIYEQSRFFGQILEGFTKSNPLNTKIWNMTGSYLLLNKVIELGMPLSYLDNDSLFTLLNGKQAILSPIEYQLLLLNFYQQVSQKTNSEINFNLQEIFDQRLEKFSSFIHEHVKLNRQSNLLEQIQVIADTIIFLKLFRQIHDD